METKICLLFGIFPEDNYQEIFSCSKRGMQNAADALQKSIIAGLAEYSDNVTILNFPFIGSYPNNYTKPFSPSNKFEFSGINGKNIRFFNGSVVKHHCIYSTAKKELRKYLEANKDQDVSVVVYSLNPSLLYACAKLKPTYQFSLIAVVPDLYQFTSMQNNGLRNIFKRWNYKYLSRSYDYIDGYVLLTNQMSEALPINGKPYTVVEGIYNPNNEIESNASTLIKNQPTKDVLYTGTLSSLYGLPNLIKAFGRLTNPDYRLIICGGGADDKMLAIINDNKDSRIQFRGLLKREDVLKLQRQASLLVNPRTSEGIFTKYSFPSKTMEYLASGTPTLMYRLPGIPNEYFGYCYSPTDETIDALVDKISEILESPESERNALGVSAREFILSKKNPKSQTNKIIKLINQCQSLKTRLC